MHREGVHRVFEEEGGGEAVEDEENAFASVQYLVLVV